jgi:hypothetical protein
LIAQSGNWKAVCWSVPTSTPNPSELKTPDSKSKKSCTLPKAKGYNSNLIKDIPIDTATFKAVIQQIDTGELYKEYAIKITLTITITITGRTQTIEFEGSEFC